MDPEETPVHGMEEVEAPATSDATVDRPGAGSGKSSDQCLQWPRTVVECRCIALERRTAHCLLPKTGSCLSDGGGQLAHSDAQASVFMNRRIRNRTSGGVGGWRGWQHPRLLPDPVGVRPHGFLTLALVLVAPGVESEVFWLFAGAEDGSSAKAFAIPA